MTNDEHSERQEALGPPVQRPVGRLAPERCRDCGLTLAPWLRLYCTRCVLPHIGSD